MSNKITINDLDISDDVLLEGRIHIENSMVADTLGADTFSFVVYDPASTSELLSLSYAEPVYYYIDEVLVNKFYISGVSRIEKTRYRIDCVSAIGLLTKMKHNGGIYYSAQASAIIDSILSDTNIEYEVDDAVGITPISGWLPRRSKRDNLQSVLFACGASILKNSDGSLSITYNHPSETKQISSDRIYLGGEIKLNVPATKITISEHNFYASPATEEKEVYVTSGNPADHSFIEFSQPIHSLRSSQSNGVDDITIHESGANYAIISGTGILYGKQYIHLIENKTWQTDGFYLEANEKNVTDAYLISALNSANVLSRLVNYFTTANEVSYNIVLNSDIDEFEPLHTGDLIAFVDPFGDDKSGFVKNMEVTMSNTIKANTNIVTDWQPTDVGNNFSHYALFAKDKTIIDGVESEAVTSWTVPTGTTEMRVVCVGGFRGGQGGSHGTSGTNASDAVQIRGLEYSNSYYRTPGVGGKGGKGGQGGSGVMVYTQDFEDPSGTFAISIGTGGQGSAAVANGQTAQLGSLGGNTTFGTISSADGYIISSGFINIMTGELYGLPGESDNLIAGDGGKGTQLPLESSGYEFILGGEGVGISYKGDTYRGGTTGRYVLSYNGGGGWAYAGYGGAYGGGGGAAVASNGGNGGTPTAYTANGIAGNGGNGANGKVEGKAAFGFCGNGGHGGGGGGGAGGNCFAGRTSDYRATGGAGGTASAGGQGSDGFVLCYWG